MAFYQNNSSDSRLGTSFLSSGTRAAISLNSAYVHRTSGAGIAVRIESPISGPLNEVLLFLDAVGGTLGSITMRCRIYNESAAAAQPGTTLLATASTVTMPGAVDQWIRAQFATPYNVTAGEVLWIVWDNTAAAPATNFPQILTSTNTVQLGGGRFQPYSSTNGFSTAGTLQSEMPNMFQIGSTWYGNPITQGAVNLFTSNTLKRGIVITPRVNVVVKGFDGVSGANLTQFDVYESTQLPNDTPIHTFSLSALERLLNTYTLSSPITLFRGRTYYIVADFSSNTNSPGGGQVENYSAFPAAFDQMIDGMYYVAGVQEVAGNAWSLFNNFVPNLRVVINDFELPTITS